MNDSEKLIEIFENSMSLTGFINGVKLKFIKALLKKVKSDLGRTYSITTKQDISRILDILDEKFNLPNILQKDKKGNYLFDNDIFKIISLNSSKNNTYLFIYGDFNTKDGVEKLYLYFFGKMSIKYYNKFQHYIKQTNTLTRYLVSAGEQGYWTSVPQVVTSRDFSTLYFEHNLEKQIITHLDKWLSNKEIYESRGIPFKTGLLFYGKGGTGKSSLALAIANYLHCNIINIDPTTFQHLNISEFVTSVNNDNKTYVILLDEIDTLFTSRSNENITDEQKEKTVKLLTFLDGSNSINNAVFIATTNYIDRLDQNLLRKGRFDKIFEVGNISYDLAIKMCKDFGLNNKDIEEILHQFSKNEDDIYYINPATLQGIILERIKN